MDLVDPVPDVLGLEDVVDLRKLRIFLEVARWQSVGAAAVALSYSPAAVSRNVSALERRLGVTLLATEGRGIRLTGPGQELAVHARALLDEAQRMHEAMARFRPRDPAPPGAALRPTPPRTDAPDPPGAPAAGPDAASAAAPVLLDLQPGLATPARRRLAASARCALSAFGADLVAFLRADPVTRTFVEIGVGASTVEDARGLDGVRYDLDAYPATGRMLAEGAVVQARADDPRSDGAERRFLQEQQLAQLVMVPLGSARPALVFMEVFHRVETAIDRRALRSLARTGRTAPAAPGRR